MIEIPESSTLARQAAEVLTGRTVTAVFNATQPHKFAWYAGDPALYPALLVGRRFCGAEGHGAFVDLCLDGDIHITVGDGTNLRYCESGADIPAKYQLLIGLDNDAFLVFTVAMYGAIYATQGRIDSPYYTGAAAKPSPLAEGFDTTYFEGLFAQTKPTLSAKAFLATQQRIPGLGNGTLQDILFRARIHPKRKIAGLDAADRKKLYEVLHETLCEMTRKGGRDTERDLFGNPGGYRTLLSQKTFGGPCPVCGGDIRKEPYLGGAVYYCPCCQPLN